MFHKNANFIKIYNRDGTMGKSVTIANWRLITRKKNISIPLRTTLICLRFSISLNDFSYEMSWHLLNLICQVWRVLHKHRLDVIAVVFSRRTPPWVLLWKSLSAGEMQINLSVICWRVLLDGCWCISVCPFNWTVPLSSLRASLSICYF